MLTQLYSTGFLVFLAGALVVCLRQPFTGLLIVVGVSPFYTLLRESSTGSPVFFLWPYVLTGALLFSMGATEAARWFPGRGPAGVSWRVWFVLIGVMALAGLALELEVGALSGFVADAALASMPEVLTSYSFLVVALGALAGLIALVAVFLAAMRQREGRVSVLDLIVVAFLLYGLFQVFNTYWRTVFFTGLNGLRYYFIGALIYFPTRYYVRSVDQERRVVGVFLVACMLGALQFLAENALLNVLEISPDRMPWVGHLAQEFEYFPEGDRRFLEGRYVPLGLMYMHHMSGLFLLLGFVMLLPLALVARGWRQTVGVTSFAWLLFTNVVWTSRTGLLVLLACYPLAAALLPVSWTRRFVGAVTLGVALFVSSQYLIPGARYDVASDLDFVASQGFENLGRVFLSDVQVIAERLRPLEDLAEAEEAYPVALAEAEEAYRDPRPGWYLFLFGLGAQSDAWNQVFFSTAPGRYMAATRSDTKYLEFAEQFGAMGLMLLMALGGLGVFRGWCLILASTAPASRAFNVGLTLILFVTFVSLVHHPTLFRVGYHTVVFTMLGIVASRGSARRAQPIE